MAAPFCSPVWKDRDFEAWQPTGLPSNPANSATRHYPASVPYPAPESIFPTVRSVLLPLTLPLLLRIFAHDKLALAHPLFRSQAA
jgi:hypothetical protein